VRPLPVATVAPSGRRVRRGANEHAHEARDANEGVALGLKGMHMVRERAIQLTPAGKVKLEEELAHLLKVKRPDLANRIAESGAIGDQTDNAQQDGVKEELVQIDGRIAELEQMLERAVVLDAPSTDQVGLGATVTIRDQDGVEETWLLVDHAEMDTRDGSISTESPVGRALVGKRVGDSATVQTPGGVIVYTVIRIA
jgi:transcription elongation factor GreA